MFRLSLISGYIRGRTAETIVECRHCGMSVDPNADRCSACGHDGIATYVIE